VPTNPLSRRTPAYSAFLENMAEVRALLKIHGILGGSAPGRRWGTEVLNKTAIVLLVACWEAYLEDVAAFAFQKLLACCTEPREFPKDVLKRVGDSLRACKDERMIWNIAGDGWKAALSDYRSKVIDSFHNPNSKSVDGFFFQVLGLKEISTCWHWPGMSVERARAKLNGLVSIRGSIAHRVKHTAPVHLSQVKNYRGHVRRLVQKTDRKIRRLLKII
jgi:RiboL-PSP-HEPN